VGIKAASPARAAGIDNRVRLERALVRVRWFGVAFAFFQIYSGSSPACPSHSFDFIPELSRGVSCEAYFVRPLGYSLALSLAVFNLVAALLVSRGKGRGIKHVGVAMFIVDHIFLIAFCWMFSNSLNTTAWVMLYILPLEGAYRWGLGGSLTSIGILSIEEGLREAWRHSVWAYPFHLVPDTTFRVGIMTIIGLIGGIMARNLIRQTRELERKAKVMQELAERETEARRELIAFHRAMLAGVSTGDLDQAMKRLTDVIAETLGYEMLCIGLLEGQGTEQVVRLVSGYNFPDSAVGITIPLNEGICGAVVRTGKPKLVDDLSPHERHPALSSDSRSEMAVPLRVGTRVIGVLNAESSKVGAFAEEDLEKLQRMAAQVAVVVENAKLLEKETEAVQRFTELDAMKTDFIAITSHELRTPLTVIRGFIQTLRRPDIDFSEKDTDGYLEVIERQSNRLYSIVEDLLFISRMEAGIVELHYAPFDVKEAIEEVIQERFSSNTRISVGGDTQRAVSDRDRVKRVAGNLLDNALRFSSPESSVSVEVGGNEEWVEFVVSDVGSGIPESEVDRVFDRFHQVGGSMGREQQGFGLGLYIVKRILEAIDGSVEVESIVSHGSSFTIRIPRRMSSKPETHYDSNLDLSTSTEEEQID
jgi:signal transduction histidine kinase